MPKYFYLIIFCVCVGLLKKTGYNKKSIEAIWKQISKFLENLFCVERKFVNFFEEKN